MPASKPVIEELQNTFGSKYGLALEYFEQYKKSPESLPDHWRKYFDDLENSISQDESITESLKREVDNLSNRDGSAEKQAKESEIVKEAQETAAPSEQFSEAPQEESEFFWEIISGIYKKNGLTIKLGSDLLPKDENIIVLYSDWPSDHPYKSFYNEILLRLGVNSNELTRRKPDFNFSRYDFFQITASQIIALTQAQKGENPNPFDMEIVDEMRYMFKGAKFNSVFDSSLYYTLSNTSEKVRVSPLQFVENAGVSELGSISFTLPYPSSAEKRLIKDLSSGWEELETRDRSESEPTPVDNSPHDKIDFHLDDPALDDKLSRRPIAEDLARIIDNDIFGNKKCYSFMAHLQGRWGEGKSSFMSFLEEGLQLHGKKKWIVIHYNAWENQHVDPPWWTFLDALYKQAKEQIGKKRPLYSKWAFQISEFVNRFNKASLRLIIFVLVIVILLMILVPFEERITNTFSFLAPLLGETKVTILALLGGGTLITIIQSWSKFLFLHNAENARLFVSKTENPAEAIRSHFDNLIHSIQRRSGSKEEPFKIAFFIDDLDRCDSRYVIKLLEGIQTMFNKQKVFYLVAADKHWIAKSFEHEYSKYSDTVKKGTKLGYSFIEKNFQLSIRLPNPSPTQISHYWDYILNAKNQEPKKDSKESIQAFKTEFNQTTQAEILSGDADINSMLEKHQISFETAQSIVLEKVNETTEDIEHLLREYHKLIGSNPRAVKRLANQYTIYRNIILIEQSRVDPKKLFRWIVLQNRWPILADQIEMKPEIIAKITKTFLEQIKLENHLDAIKYVIGTEKERLTKEDVITYSGVSNLASNLINNA